MPKKIKNPKIIEVMKECVRMRDELASIIDFIKESSYKMEIEAKLDEKTEALNKKQREGFIMMNEEYGWGKWMDVDAKKLTFIPEEEIGKEWYIMNNPAIRPRVQADDVAVIESKVGAESVSIN